MLLAMAMPKNIPMIRLALPEAMTAHVPAWAAAWAACMPAVVAVWVASMPAVVAACVACAVSSAWIRSFKSSFSIAVTFSDRWGGTHPLPTATKAKPRRVASGVFDERHRGKVAIVMEA